MPSQAKKTRDNVTLERELPILSSPKELEVRDFILENPASWEGFRAIATLLESSGDDAGASECHMGKIPDHVQRSFFGVTSDLFTVENFGTEFSNIHKSDSTIPRSASVNNTARLTKYINNNLISSPTHVSEFHKAKLWFDGYNTIVSNKNDEVDKTSLAGNFAPAWFASKKLPPTSVSGQVVLMGCKGSNNYYHWMTDILPKFAILKKAGIELTHETKYVFTNISSKFQIDTLKHLGISSDQIYQTNVLGQHLSVDKLIVPRLANRMGLNMGAWLPEYMKETFNVNSKRPTFRKILVTRNAVKSHGRGIDNIAEFNQYFLSKGYETIFPEDYTVCEQAQLFSEATHVVGPHGAGLTNLLFCQPQTKVYELYGDHLAPCYWAISELSGLDYGNLNCSEYDLNNSSKLNNARSLHLRRSCSFRVELSSLNENFI